MTFIEVHPSESASAVEQIIAEAYAPTYNLVFPDTVFPSIRLGKAIRWNGRTFRELCLPPGPTALELENLMFHSASMPKDRARIMVGSMQGKLFTTPPVGSGESAARFIDCGRCSPEISIRPFLYSVQDEQA